MAVKKLIIIIGLIQAIALIVSSGTGAEPIVSLSTIDWEPYTGKKLSGHGFFSELVTASFKRSGYRVEFHYLPWARALQDTKDGKYDGLMAVYWSAERARYLSYPDIVWKVKEEFIALRDNPIHYNGSLASLKAYTIGVLNHSLQADEVTAAGIKTQPVSYQNQNVKLLLLKRIDVVLAPRSIFYHYLEIVEPHFDRSRLRILKPPYKTYDMYVAFSKERAGYERLTSDFNHGLGLIKADGTFDHIIQKHQLAPENTSQPD